MSDRQQPTVILVAVDLDAAAESALSHGCAWAREFGAAVAVLHVVEASMSESNVHAASRDLRSLVEKAAPGGVPRSQSFVKVGRPAAVIPASAASMGADLVVMGSHRRGTVGRWLLGSVAAEVLRHTDTPVLIVKAPGGSVRGGTLVVAVDFSPASEAAVRHAGRMAAEGGASLHLLHALPIGDHRSPGHVVMREEATKALRELQERHVPPTVTTELHVAMRMDTPANAIAHYAEDQQADLIAMGGHGASGWTRGVLGSVTERVLHETSLPVLVVRQAHDDTRGRDVTDGS